LNKKSLPHKTKKLPKFSNLYWVSRGENFEPKLLIAQKAVNNQIFVWNTFKWHSSYSCDWKKPKNYIIWSLGSLPPISSWKPTHLQKWTLRPCYDFFKRRLLANLVADIKLWNLYLNKFLITVTPSLFLGTEFIDVFGNG